MSVAKPIAMTAARAIEANAEAPRSFVRRSEVSLLDPGYDLLVQIARGVMGFAALNPSYACYVCAALPPGHCGDGRNHCEGLLERFFHPLRSDAIRALAHRM